MVLTSVAANISPSDRRQIDPNCSKRRPYTEALRFGTEVEGDRVKIEVDKQKS